MISVKEAAVVLMSCVSCVVAFVMSIFATKVAEKYVIRVEQAVGIDV